MDAISTMSHTRILALGVLLVACAAAPVVAQDDAQDLLQPKLGPDAVPITVDRSYLRTAEAPDYWTLSAYYVPQFSSSACSVASVAMMVNALRGLPPLASDRLVSQNRVLTTVADDHWREATAEDGEGVSFTEFEDYVRRTVRAFGLNAVVDVFRPRDSSPETLAELRRILAENERSDDDIVLVAFDQGTLTGDANVGHIAPLGAYDAARQRVLVMDVDRQWYVPYWTSDEKLLEAMLKPDRADPTGSGLVRVRLRPTASASKE